MFSKTQITIMMRDDDLLPFLVCGLTTVEFFPIGENLLFSTLPKELHYKNSVLEVAFEKTDRGICCSVDDGGFLNGNTMLRSAFKMFYFFYKPMLTRIQLQWVRHGLYTPMERTRIFINLDFKDVDIFLVRKVLTIGPDDETVTLKTGHALILDNTMFDYAAHMPDLLIVENL